MLHAAKQGDDDALARIRVVSDRIILASAHLALAREYGFSRWSALKTEVERREILTSRDLSRLTRLLATRPELAQTKMEHWCDHHRADPLGYVAMLQFDHERLGLPRDLTGTGTAARALIAAGAPVDGHPGDSETPLITAASYGDAEVARVLIEAGADLEARAAPNAGGVPEGTALLHAAVFGMTDVLDLLVKAGARVHSIEVAAAAGDVTDWLALETPLQARIRALVMAADHQRLPVIDQLIEAGTPIDAEDEQYGRQALRVAACNGRPGSVRRLLQHGANPNHRDPAYQRTALEWCRPEHRYLDGPGHAEVERILTSVTA
jgi:ankyrin repeat protein